MGQRQLPVASDIPKNSVFRSCAWLDAWLDVYGPDENIRLLAIEDFGNQRGSLYAWRQTIRHLWPILQLTPAGCGSHQISSPRSEYNRLECSAATFFSRIQDLGWQRILIEDICNFDFVLDVLDFLDAPSFSLSDLESLTAAANGANSRHLAIVFPRANRRSWIDAICLAVSFVEYSYCIVAEDFDNYKGALGGDTRRRYFGMRKRLQEEHSVEWEQISIAALPYFCAKLNAFHRERWGRPCYSQKSQEFISKFLLNLESQGGVCDLSAMRIDGEIRSVLLDVEWRDRRYNLQSGYDASWSNRYKLGSIHIGKKIEESIKSRRTYDLLAGQGLRADYKRHIATHVIPMFDFELCRGGLAYVRWLQLKLRHQKTTLA